MCSLTSTSPTTLAGTIPHITVSGTPGKYCVEIYDVGNLTSTATFSIKITHS
jgi:hypothetical protein